MKTPWSKLALIATLWTASLATQADYSQHPKAEQFIQEVTNEYKIDPEHVRQWLRKAEKQTSVLEAMERPAEGVLEWDRYQDIFLTKERIKKGKEFMQAEAAILADAEKKYGVDKHIIAAIIGVETYYGARQGNYRVLDALTTLAFDYPKRPLFWRELKAFFSLIEVEGLDASDIKGSYAGAIGFGQFIPTSYLAYAVDGDGDGKRDLRASSTDAIHSVANYFKRHGWKTGEPVVQRARVRGKQYQKAVNDHLKPQWTVGELKKLGVRPTQKVSDDRPASLVRLQGKHGAEFWLAEYNYYVITRYNHSRLYAMAVYQLSESLR